MDAKELLEQIEAFEGELPKVRYVPEVYAAMLAQLASKLSEDELKDMVALGAQIKNRCSRLIPVYKLGNLPDHILKGGRPIT